MTLRLRSFGSGRRLAGAVRFSAMTIAAVTLAVIAIASADDLHDGVTTAGSARPEPVAEVTPARQRQKINRFEWLLKPLGLFGRDGDDAPEAMTPRPAPETEDLRPSEDSGDGDGVPLAGNRINLTESSSERAVDGEISRLYAEFEERLARFTDPDLRLPLLRGMEQIPEDFEAAWSRVIRDSFWAAQERYPQRLEDVYVSTLEHSFHVRELTYSPLLQETVIAAADARFDPEIFASGQTGHVNEPTGTTLTTGTTGRLFEDRSQAEAGTRKRLVTGTQIELANEIESLKNNSTFLDPNPQTQSGVTLRVVQPLLRGRGIAVNTIGVKVATFDTRTASDEMLMALESHLLDVNRNYWGAYLARAAYAQRVDLVNRTREIVELLEAREQIDAEATASETLRARASLLEREADLIRSKTAIRTAEERLRSLINDPEMPMGSASELIPATRPVMSPPEESIDRVARSALEHRQEISRSIATVRAAGLRRDAARNELLPELNLIGEVGYSGLDANRDLGGAYDDLSEHGATWQVGFAFSQSLERGFAKSALHRRELEYGQAVNQMRLAGNSVILSVLVAYREMVTSYQDMQAKYQAVTASREEVRKLEELVEIDAGEEAGRTMGYRLQLLLDAIERNQYAEEAFLVSVVSYNFSLAAMERAKGTFLQVHGVEIEREESPSWRQPDELKFSTSGAEEGRRE